MGSGMFSKSRLFKAALLPLSKHPLPEDLAMSGPIFLAGGVRTAIGNLNGALAGVSATALGSVVIKAALQRSGIAAQHVDEVIMGNVLSAGLGQNPARQAAMGAGLGPG